MSYVFGLILVTISIYEHANTLSFYHMDQITLSDKCLNIIVGTKGGTLYHSVVVKFCNFLKYNIFSDFSLKIRK
jgi:hypothetical protein